MLDLDETLIHADHQCKAIDNHYEIVITGYAYCVHIRPWFYQFIQWCQEQQYKIIVFSAATPKYVNAVVDYLWEKLEWKPVFILSAINLKYDCITGGYNIKKIQTIIDVSHGLVDNRNQLVCIDDYRIHYPGDLDRVIWVDEWSNPNDDSDCELVTIQDCIIKMFD